MHSRMLKRTWSILAPLVVLGTLGVACGDSSDTIDTADTVETIDTTAPVETTPVVETTTTAPVDSDLPMVVVTYSALESIVEGIVGDSARVEVIVPNGTDPHDFEPSAKDVEAMSSASIVVSNGLDLEEGLEDALEQVEKSGVPVFRITDHVTLRDGDKDKDKDKDTEEDGGHDHDHGHGADDPHVWLDPLTLAEAVPALAAEIGDVLGADLATGGADVVADLGELSAAIEERISSLESCVLITGHDSLAYFGARYGCEVLGSIIPSFSTAAEATAKDLAELKDLARAEGVRAIFAELGTPADVAEQLANEVGVEVLEIATHLVPDGGGYDEMMLALADVIVAGLA